MAEFHNTTINTVRYGDTIATIGASAVAPVFNYETRANNHIYVDDIDVTYIIDKRAEALKEEAIAYEKSKPKPKPKDPVKSILINPVKGVTTVVWNDNTVTIVHCDGEEFDAEKGIAMCFMKKVFNNRGCFNDFLKKYLEDKNWTQKPKTAFELHSAGSYSFTLEDAQINPELFKITGIQPMEKEEETGADEDCFIEFDDDDWREIFGSKEDDDETE